MTESEETGFRFYCWDYIAELLEFKVSEMPGAYPWIFVKPKLLPVSKRFFDTGLFLAHILDDANLGFCKAAFTQGQSVDIEICLQLSVESDAPKLSTAKGDAKLRFMSEKATREMFWKDAKAHGQQIDKDTEAFITRLVDKLYGERLTFVCADAANAGALHMILKKEHDVDVKVRFKISTGAAQL